MHGLRGAEVINLNEWQKEHGDDDDDDRTKPLTSDEIKYLMTKYPSYFSEEEHTAMFPDYAEVVCDIYPWNDHVLRRLRKGKYKAYKEPKDPKEKKD